MLKHSAFLLTPVAAFALGVVAPQPAGVAASPGPIIAGTQYPDTLVTLTSAGDPATTVVLRTPLQVGAIGETTSVFWDRGTETYRRGADSTSSDYELTIDRTGVDEVLEVRPDGGALVRWTYGPVTVAANWSNPDFVQDLPDFASLEGRSVLVDFDPARQSRSIHHDAASPLSDAQAELMTGDRWSLTIPVPAEPVGVGATWTWSQSNTVYGLDFDIPMTTTLTSVDGDRYTASTSFSFDLAAGPVELTPTGGVASVSSGQFTGTVSSDGSLRNPLDYHEKWESTSEVVLTLDDGWTFEAQAAATSEYWERPAPGA